MGSEWEVAGGAGDGVEVTEEYLSRKAVVTPEEVRKLRGATTGYLTLHRASPFSIRFNRFKMRNFDTDETLLELVDDSDEGLEEDQVTRYYFSPEFLSMERIGTTVEFSVGERAIRSFRMIERHYFRDIPLTYFDFDMGYCIPNSVNTCENIYHLPALPRDLIAQIIEHPFETKSDCFFFADGQLFMQNKGEYSFCDPGVSDERDLDSDEFYDIINY